MVCQKVIGSGLVLVLLIVAGCAKPGTDPTVKVTGTVTYKGTPVSGASVGFFPEKGRPGSGTTDAQGKFTLSTFRRGDGAVPGLHKVTIADVVETPKKGTPEAEKWQPPPPRFPAKYADAKKSGLTAEVKQGDKNDFTFNMTD